MYTIDNPKAVKCYCYLREKNFTGVVKDQDGDIAYYVNGKIHRTDGPAFIWKSGRKEYWIDGEFCSNISTDEELKDYLILRMFE